MRRSQAERRLYRRLRATAGRLQRASRHLRRALAAASQTEAVQALSAYDNHPADQAGDTLAREIDLGLVLGFRDLHAEARRALQKWQDGTYGLCDRCGRPIEPERLQARPQSIWCRACAEVQARKARVGPDGAVIPPPFGRPAGLQAVEAGGERFWQAVARYGTSNSPQDQSRPGIGTAPEEPPVGVVTPPEAAVGDRDG